MRLLEGGVVNLLRDELEGDQLEKPAHRRAG